MALPSQTERQTEIGRSYVYNQRSATANGARTAVIIAAALVVAAGAVWGLLTLVNRRSATSTLPLADGKAEVMRSAAQPKTPTLTPTPTPTPTPTSISLASNPAPTPTDCGLCLRSGDRKSVV